MSRWRRRTPRSALLAAALCLPLGCTIFAPRADPSRFFVLTPLPPGPSPAVFARSLGVGPVMFPSYLDRSEMVARVSSNEVSPAAFDYWAGSLPRQFEATLAQNLQTLLGAGPVKVFPWYASAAPDLIVEVDVRDFERVSDGRAHFSARWRVCRGAGGEIVSSGESRFDGASASADPGSTAAALSALLGDFSRELAERIRSLG